MQASTLGSAPTDTALLISQEGVTFGQFGHRIICHGEISIHKRKEKKKAYKTDSSEEDFSHQYQHEPRELCAEQVSLALQGQRQISSQQFHLNSQLTTPKQESMVSPHLPLSWPGHFIPGHGLMQSLSTRTVML